MSSTPVSLVSHVVGPRSPERRSVFQRNACLAVLALAGMMGLSSRVQAQDVTAGLSMQALLSASLPATQLDPVAVTAPAPAVVQPAALPQSLALGVWTSQPGETKLAFVQRLSVVLETFTLVTDFEACGKIMKAPTEDRWRVALSTGLSHVGCVELEWHDPNFEVTKESIHSHPRMTSVELSARDLLLSESAGRHALGSRVGVSPGQFSDTDYATGPGYVVAQQGTPFFRHSELLYQNGKGTDQDLGRLPSLESVHLLADALQGDESLYQVLPKVDVASARLAAKTVDRVDEEVDASVKASTQDPSAPILPSRRSSRL